MIAQCDCGCFNSWWVGLNSWRPIFWKHLKLHTLSNLECINPNFPQFLSQILLTFFVSLKFYCDFITFLHTGASHILQPLHAFLTKMILGSNSQRIRSPSNYEKQAGRYGSKAKKNPNKWILSSSLTWPNISSSLKFCALPSSRNLHSTQILW